MTLKLLPSERGTLVMKYIWDQGCLGTGKDRSRAAGGWELFLFLVAATYSATFLFRNSHKKVLRVMVWLIPWFQANFEVWAQLTSGLKRRWSNRATIQFILEIIFWGKLTVKSIRFHQGTGTVRSESESPKERFRGWGECGERCSCLALIPHESPVEVEESKKLF